MRNIRVDISLPTQLSDQELEEVVTVSNLAYLDADSPWGNILTGGNLELLPDLFRSMTRGCLIDGECLIAKEVTTQKIVGVALWFPPGKFLWATDESRQISGFNDFFDQLDQATKDWWLNDYGAQVGKFFSEYYGPETALGSWWLGDIAVLPAYQGNGIGGSLFKPVVKRASVDEAIGCFTDTEKNVKFYEALGMKNIGILYLRHPVNGRDLKMPGLKRYGDKALAH